MTLTIVVPLDGSPGADRALPFAAQLVSGGRGRLLLAHVQSSRYADVPPHDDPATHLDALHRAGVTATSFVYHAPDEDVATVLDLAIRDAAVDLVVMSTHGRGGLGRSVFGSVADQLIRRAEVPVLLVPASCEVSWQTRPPAQILVPLDGSHLAEQALISAAELARLLDAEILLVRALSPALHTRYRGDKLTLSCADFAEVEDAWQYLAGIANGLRAGGCRSSFWVLVGSPSASIADAARTEDVDMIVMTTHGRGGLSRLVFGSTADGVLQRAHVPILLVRSGAANRAALATATSTEGETATKTVGFAASVAGG